MVNTDQLKQALKTANKNNSISIRYGGSKLGILDKIHIRDTAYVASSLDKILERHEATQDDAALIDALKAFLSKRWDDVAGFYGGYTVCPKSHATTLCLEIARWLHQQDNSKAVYQYLMPTLTHTVDTLSGLYVKSIDELDLSRVILSEDKKSLIPTRLLANLSPTTNVMLHDLVKPYVEKVGDVPSKLTVKEQKALIRHSHDSYWLYEGYERIHKFRKNSNAPDYDKKIFYMTTYFMEAKDAFEKGVDGRDSAPFGRYCFNFLDNAIITKLNNQDLLGIIQDYKGDADMLVKMVCEAGILTKQMLIANKQGDTPLLVAITELDPDCVKAMLEVNADLDAINVRDKNGDTPLHVAVKKGIWTTQSSRIVQLIIDKNASLDVLNIRDKNGDTPLLIALKNGYLDIAKLIIKKNGSLEVLNLGDKNGDTPLRIALKNGYTDIAQLIIEKNASIINIKDKHGMTPLLLALAQGDKDTAKLILEKDPSLGVINVTGGDTYTPLMFAAIFGFTDIADIILAQDASPNVINAKNRYGNTPFLLACSKGHINTAKLIVEKDIHSVVINTKNNDVNTPLLLALENGHTDIAKWILDIDDSADVLNAKNKQGDTPLLMALKKGHTDIAKWLICKGVSVAVKNIYGDMPLLLALKNGHTDIAELIIEKEASLVALNAKNKDGDTPFWVALKNGHIDIAKLLVDKDESGEILNTRNNKGDTPLLWALHHDRTDIAELIIEKDANFATINSKRKEDIEPFLLALMKGNLKIAKLIIEKNAGLDVINAKSNYGGTTPLMLAASRGYTNIAKLIVDQDASLAVLHAKNNEGDTPLLIALRKGNIDIAELIVDKNPSLAVIDAKNKNGDSPVLWAFKNNNTDIAKRILNKIAEVTIFKNLDDKIKQLESFDPAYHFLKEALIMLRQQGIIQLIAKINRAKLTKAPDLTRIFHSLPLKKIVDETVCFLDDFMLAFQTRVQKFQLVREFENKIYQFKLLPIIGKCLGVIIIAALCATTGAAIGFGIGLLAGAWMGPGALVTAFMGMGLGATVSGYAFFKPAPVTPFILATNQVIQTAHSCAAEADEEVDLFNLNYNPVGIAV